MKGKTSHPTKALGRAFTVVLGIGAGIVLIAKAAGSVERLERVRILRCYDGDTCTTTTGERIRLACIDTPELRGKRADPVPAKAARDYTRALVVGRDVDLRRITTDRWGRTVGELFVDGTNVQEALVRAGHASVYWKFAHQCPWIR